MDQRGSMDFSGSQSLYMERGMASTTSGTQTGLQGSQNIQSLSNPNAPFQLYSGINTIGSTLPGEPSSTISPYGGNVGAPPMKRKRGRPRKYGPDGTVSLALSPSSSTNPWTLTSTQKRGRGRPPGTGRKQQLAHFGEKPSSSSGIGFAPHIITIAIGEDIATKIMSFSQQGPRVICVLSASGSVSTVTLRQPATSGGSVTYEGYFEIICLSGSYTLSDDGISMNHTGGLSVCLASPDGRVIGGGVGGALIAASPVQVIVGSFMWGGSNKNKKREALEGAIDSGDRQRVENPTAISSIPQNQSLTPFSSVSVWPTSHPVDMSNTQIDIDLMRR